MGPDRQQPEPGCGEESVYEVPLRQPREPSPLLEPSHEHVGTSAARDLVNHAGLKALRGGPFRCAVDALGLQERPKPILMFPSGPSKEATGSAGADPADPERDYRRADEGPRVNRVELGPFPTSDGRGKPENSPVHPIRATITPLHGGKYRSGALSSLGW